MIESGWYTRLVGAVAGNVMTSNVINKNDATKRELNFEMVVCSDVKSLIVVDDSEQFFFICFFFSADLLVSAREMIIFFRWQLVFGLGVKIFNFLFFSKLFRHYNSTPQLANVIYSVVSLP